MEKRVLKLKKKFVARKTNPQDQAIVVPVSGDIVILRTKKAVCEIYEHGGKTYGMGIKGQPVVIAVDDDVIEASMNRNGFFAIEDAPAPAKADVDVEEEHSEPIAPYVKPKKEKK